MRRAVEQLATGRRGAYVAATILIGALLLISALYVGSLSQSGSRGSSSTASTSSSETTTPSGASVPLSSEWLTYHKNDLRTGDDDLAFPSMSSPAMAWKTPVDSHIFAEELVYDHMVFVATENDTVYALSLSS